ncbi:MAG: NifU family protein [Nitrospirae bacterium]|nr:NifU family protein [Nitrospirota bacterium]
MIEWVEKIIEVLDEIRPDLIAEGGDVRLAGLEEGVVYVRMVGPFTAWCQTKRRVLRDVERVLKARVPWIERIEAVCPPPGSQAQ